MRTSTVTLIGIALVLFGAGAQPSDGARFAAPLRNVDVYVAQASTGSGGGSSCANAKPATFFNTPSNWGPSRPIAPGKVVGLCGTITSTLAAQGSGAAGSPVTILFLRGAKISQPACGPCLSLRNRSFLAVDGGANGIIEGTNNGTNLGLRSASTGITASSCDNCEVKNLTIRNIYVHSGRDDEIDQTLVRAIVFTGDNFSFHDNDVHDAGWAIGFGNNGDSNNRVYNNDIYNVDHGIVPSFGSAGGSAGPFYVYGNHFHDFGNWDTSNNAYHHDGIHCYTVAGGRGQHINDFYIYNNRFDGSIGGNATAWIFIEGAPRHDQYDTPCADSTSNIWVFNNFAALDHDLNNGAFGLFSGINKVYNNTLVGRGTAHGAVCEIGTVDGVAFQNNICTTGNNIVGMSKPSSGSFAPGSPDFNVYANGGGNAFVCYDGTIHFWSFSQFSLFRACVGGDRHSIAPATAGLDSAGVPQRNSPVVGAGTNLNRLCKGNLKPLCFDINGALRPVRMSPDVGAVQVETAAIASRSIGRIRIGDSRAAIERFYGQRRAASSKRAVFGIFDLRHAMAVTYRLHKGLLRVSYLRNKAAAVSTTSRYYTTTGGFGVGSPASSKKLVASGWRPCGPNFLRRRAGIVTAIRVTRGRVVSVALSVPANTLCP